MNTYLSHFLNSRYKFNNVTIHLFFLILFLSFIDSIYAQDQQDQVAKEGVKHQISFKHDNDFLAFSDRYYTSGLYLSYNRLLNKGMFKADMEQISIALGQQIYTPAKINTTNIAEMDRPYAGYMELNLGWSYVNGNNRLVTDFALGLTGKASGAGAFHRWYHNALSIPKPPTWAYELNNKMHANLYSSYTREWQLSQNNFSVHLAVRSELAIGTKDIYAQPEFIAHFGRRQAMKSSMAYNRIGSTEKEVFFSICAGYRFLPHNALLEGHLFGDNSTFLVNPNSKYFYGGFDIKHRDKKNDFWFGYRFNSSETKETKLHKYIIMSYARSF